MELEREMVGLAVAELPISQGWEIRHTPRPDESTAEALAFLASCDLYVLILGTDFAAPMGLEWNEAQRTGKVLLTYRKLVLHSPAAQEFIRRAEVDWVDFTSPHEFKERFSRELVQMLLDRGEVFGLHVEDVEALLALVQQEEKETPAPADLERRRGAGRGGIILGRPG